jgi:hypothetical protein
MRVLLRRARRVRARIVAGTLVLTGATLIGVGGAAGETFTTTIPIGFLFTNACVDPPETFTAAGNLRLAISGTASSGGTVTSRFDTTLQGFKAQAVTLNGTKNYVVPGESTDSFFFDEDLAPFHLTTESMLQFVRQGNDGTYIIGDDFYEHVLVRVRVDANGTARVEEASGDSRCQ